MRVGGDESRLDHSPLGAETGREGLGNRLTSSFQRVALLTMHLGIKWAGDDGTSLVPARASEMIVSAGRAQWWAGGLKWVLCVVLAGAFWQPILISVKWFCRSKRPSQMLWSSLWRGPKMFQRYLTILLSATSE